MKTAHFWHFVDGSHEWLVDYIPAKGMWCAKCFQYKSWSHHGCIKSPRMRSNSSNTGLILGLRPANERRRYFVSNDVAHLVGRKPRISLVIYPSQRERNVIIASLLRQIDVTTSFWRNYDVYHSVMCPLGRLPSGVNSSFFFIFFFSTVPRTNPKEPLLPRLSFRCQFA